MILPPRLPENFRRRFPRARSWWIPAALLALTPKCIACVLGYASLGAMLGLGGPELCGATGGASENWDAWLPLFGLVGAVGVFTFRRFRA
ncbi:MAG TPA: hypothetical protein VMM36_00600 [Opitutaceae bacterium]|nr:hypothetical protein [Opitutaceae bacterium]